MDENKLSRILGQKPTDSTAATTDRWIHAGAFADDVVASTVRFRPIDRIQTASELASQVRQLITRCESGGHALDLRLPQRCLFCGIGKYEPVAEPPTWAMRNAPPHPTVLPSDRPGIWNEMRSRTINSIGQPYSGRGGNHEPVPLNLVFGYCGNLQQFRWHRPSDAQKNWKP